MSFTIDLRHFCIMLHHSTCLEQPIIKCLQFSGFKFADLPAEKLLDEIYQIQDSLDDGKCQALDPGKCCYSGCQTVVNTDATIKT